MSPGSVTVSVLAYQSADTITACLRSCLALDHDGPLRIVVREQGGDDDEAKAIAAVIEEAIGGPPISFVRSENLGFSGGHNTTIREWPSDFVLVLNADATVSPSLLRTILPAFEDETVAAVQPKVLLAGPVGATARIDSAGLVAHRSRQFTTRGHGADDDGKFDTREDIFGADGAAVLYRRTALDDVAVPFAAFARTAPPAADHVEYFDESFFAYKEDVDLAWRLQWRGWRTVFVPDAIAHHHRTARTSAEPSLGQAVRDRLRMSGRVRGWGFANQRLMQVKNEDGRALARDLRPWLVRELAAWAFGFVTDPRLILAVGRMARLTPMATRKRRWIKRNRRAGADPYRWFA